MKSLQRFKTSRRKQMLVVCLLIVGTLVALGHTYGQPAPNPAQGRTPPEILSTPSNDRMTRKQQKDLLKHKHEKLKEDVDELAELALSLQKEMENTTENMLSLEVVEKAKKIEKLAKKIKNNAKGY